MDRTEAVNAHIKSISCFYQLKPCNDFALDINLIVLIVSFNHL